MSIDWPNATEGGESASSGLVALSRIAFDRFDASAILAEAAAAVATLSPCRAEATYLSIDNAWQSCPPSQPTRPDLDMLLHESGGDGKVAVPERTWGWALPTRHHDAVNGCLIVSAEAPPTDDQLLLLNILAAQTGAALGCSELHTRHTDSSAQLKADNTQLAGAVELLQGQTAVHERLSTTTASGAGEQGIADVLHQLTGLAVCIEDRFGNLRCWSGPGRPSEYPKPAPEQREPVLHRLATYGGTVTIGDHVMTLVKPHAEILGVLALIAPDRQLTAEQLYALRYGSAVLGLELGHQRNLAQTELGLRRDLVDDLLAGTDEGSAYARADALGYDLRTPQYVIVVHSPGGVDNKLVNAVDGATAALRLSCLQGRQERMVVVLANGRPDPVALHDALTSRLGTSTSVIGIGSRCVSAADIPRSFGEARRTVNIRLHSAQPGGASAYDELGFYRVIEAADRIGVVEGFVREWLGALLDYDSQRNSQLVRTLSEYLECGGSYDESAAELHIHRSTLRYRLARIGELTGCDLRDVDTRFNLHAATRAWRFLYPDGRTARSGGALFSSP